MTDTTSPQTAADEADADTVARRATQVITRMGADIRALTGERDRYRSAWCSARERAQAYGEGILRVVKDRESYQEWLRQAEERAASAPPAADRATLSGRIARRVAEDASALRMDLYDDLAAFARETGIPGLQHAQIRDRLAEFLFEGLLRRAVAGERDEQQARQECPLCSHLTCVGGKPCGVISTERGDLAEPCGCTGAEAQPPRHRWFVETRDGLADQWAPGTRYVDRRLALGRYAALNENHPTWKCGTPVERRIVRETVTYTVETPDSATPVAASTPRANENDGTVGDATILAELQQHLTDHTPSCNARTDHLMRRAAWALGMPRPAHVGGNAEDCPGCEGTNPPYPFICPQPVPAAAPVAGQPPADTGEEARPRFVRVCIACPECDHTLDENGACVNGCHVPAAVVAEPGKENSRG